MMACNNPSLSTPWFCPPQTQQYLLWLFQSSIWGLSPFLHFSSSVTDHVVFIPQCLWLPCGAPTNTVSQTKHHNLLQTYRSKGGHTAHHSDGQSWQTSSFLSHWNSDHMKCHFISTVNLTLPSNHLCLQEIADGIFTNSKSTWLLPFSTGKSKEQK